MLAFRLRSGTGRPTAHTHPQLELPATLQQPPVDASKQLRSDRHCRLLNVLVAIFGIVLALPVLLLIALAVKSTSSGSVIYSQRRVGLNRRRNPLHAMPACRRRENCGGRIFTIYKFRTMTAQKTSAEVWARADDPRITVLGATLRRYRLDELPQFVNVRLGDMNIVGPRPEQPAIFERLQDEIGEYSIRQCILPGITGWAQINHRYDQSVEDVKRKVELDLEYIRRRSAAEDLRIMAKTVPVMFGAKGSV